MSKVLKDKSTLKVKRLLLKIGEISAGCREGEQYHVINIGLLWREEDSSSIALLRGRGWPANVWTSVEYGKQMLLDAVT